MSPDPVVGDPSDMQHYNRYAYVANSPLRYTDPSGNCPVCYFIAFVVGYEMTQQGNQYWRMVGSFAMMLATQGLVDAGLGVTAGVPGDAINRAAGIANTFNTGGIGNSVLAAAIPTLATGGSVEQAATAGIFAGAFTGVGTAFAGDSVKLVSAHMLLGCAQGAASGGACGPSALAAGFGKAATIGLDARDFGVIGNGVTTAIVGGTASAIGGGKFANGAKQAAFGYLFNHLVSIGYQVSAPKLGSVNYSFGISYDDGKWDAGLFREVSFTAISTGVGFGGIGLNAGWQSGSFMSNNGTYSEAYSAGWALWGGGFQKNGEDLSGISVRYGRQYGFDIAPQKFETIYSYTRDLRPAIDAVGKMLKGILQ
jgi:hypothetical protein